MCYKKRCCKINCWSPDYRFYLSEFTAHINSSVFMCLVFMRTNSASLRVMCLFSVTSRRINWSPLSDLLCLLISVFGKFHFRVFKLKIARSSKDTDHSRSRRSKACTPSLHRLNATKKRNLTVTNTRKKKQKSR